MQNDDEFRICGVLPEKFTEDKLEFSIVQDSDCEQYPIRMSFHFEFENIPTKEELKQIYDSNIEIKGAKTHNKYRAYIKNQIIVLPFKPFEPVFTNNVCNLQISYENPKSVKNVTVELSLIHISEPTRPY